MGTGARRQRPAKGLSEASADMARGAQLKEAVLRRYVDAHGETYSDEKLAKRAHVHVNTIRRLWTGAGAELGTLISIADAVDMSVLDLLSAMQGGAVRREPSPALERIAVAVEEISRKLEPPKREAWSAKRREEELRRFEAQAARETRKQGRSRTPNRQDSEPEG